MGFVIRVLADERIELRAIFYHPVLLFVVDIILHCLINRAIDDSKGELRFLNEMKNRSVRTSTLGPFQLRDEKLPKPWEPHL